MALALPLPRELFIQEITTLLPIKSLGIPYWCRSTNVIVKFDVRIGNFKSLELPDNYRRCNLINLNDCLGCIDHRSDGVMDVYLFNDECSLWRRMYSFKDAGNSGFINSYPMCFTYGGEIVFDGKYSLYDPKSGEIKTVGYKDYGGCVRGFSYTPSLIVLEGMKPLNQLAGRKRPLNAYW
ncbi:hypothetical protein POM88_024536 [Heracleum sosnowskyi]|uniref:F-box associated domain-containing protein n=1 Tax=Heracleum sosnowskyi TaxID=360622 RepID=A0AAD8MM20_9APIA|nr:hypothetical protein POM88_024536 [Heracleum sosnowskyi]